MALLYRAELSPTKDQMRAACLKGRSWAAGLSAVQTIASYRFDDPDGEVGMEAALLADDSGTIVHVPLTYRAAPLEGAQEYLIGTMQHSVLGTRWVYDACGDPVWNTAIVRAIARGEAGADQYCETDGQRETFDPGMTVQGSGGLETPTPADGSVLGCRDDADTTLIRTPAATLVLVRIVGESVDAQHTLVGTWGAGTAVLAGLTITNR